MLVLKPCFQETCSGVTYIDRTGPYDVTTNATGYGEPNDVTGPGDFSAYTLSVWLPGQDPEGDPQVVLNLLPPPAPDSSGFYSWSFTFEDLGVTSIPSGFAYMEVRGVFEGDEYDASAGPLFVAPTRAKVDAAMKRYDPTTPCRKGCEDPAKFFMMLTSVECDGVCDQEKSESILDYIDNNIKLCC